MIMQQYDIDFRNLTKYPNAKIIDFECNSNGVILHYIIDNHELSLGASSLENAIKQWEMGLI